MLFITNSEYSEHLLPSEKQTLFIIVNYAKYNLTLSLFLNFCPLKILIFVFAKKKKILRDADILLQCMSTVLILQNIPFLKRLVS